MSCANKFIQPPLLPKDGSGYTIWKKEIEFWCSITKIVAAERAITIYFSLPEGSKAKTTAQQIPKALLNSQNGVKALLEALDEVYLPNTAMRLFNCHNNLRTITRKPDGLVHDYLSEFERAKFEFEQEGMEKDTIVLGLDLLSQCKLPQEKNQLVMSGLTEVTYANVKAKLSAIFSFEHDKYNKFADSEKSEPEEVFYSRNQFNQRGNSSNYSARFDNRSRKRPRYSKGGNSYSRHEVERNSYGRQDAEKPPAYRTKNPNGNDGRPSRCNICQSIFHWFRDCPHAHEKNATREQLKERSNQVNFSGLVAFTGFAEESSEICKIRLLREETKGCAIVDSGCATTVCGTGWMEEFIENLCDEEKNNVKESVS